MMFHTQGKTLFRGATLLVVGVLVGLSFQSHAADEPAAPPAKPTRVGYVDIAKVIKGYGRAVEAGESLTKIREGYVAQVKRIQADIKNLQEDLKGETNADLKRQIEASVVKLQRRMQDIDREAQEEVSKQADASVSEIYQQIREVISEVAVAERFDVVEIYPGSQPEENPQVAEHAIARMVLQTPAGMPVFISEEFDLSDKVLTAMNKKFPAEGDIE